MKQSINVIRPNFKMIAGALVVATALIAGCVTVNVNFPESAVQKATDDYVRDLYRTKEQSKVKSSPTPAGTSSSIQFSFISSAYANDVFTLTSAETNNIKSKMKSRIGDIINQKKEGYLGETNEGTLVIRDASKVKPLLKKKVEDLVRDENADRQALYAEIVKENKLSTNNLGQVKKSFTRSFQAESPSGTWVQSLEGAWSQKP